MASPTPVLPEVGSTIVPPGFSSPEASAASIIRMAMRSFTEPPGLKYSTLARTVALIPSVTLLSLTRGVLPTSSMIESWYRTGSPPRLAGNLRDARFVVSVGISVVGQTPWVSTA